MSKRILSVRLAMVDGEGIRASAMFYRPGYRATCREEGIETVDRMRRFRRFLKRESDQSSLQWLEREWDVYSVTPR